MTLQRELGREKEAERISNIADRAISAVEQKLWSEEEGAHIDIQETHHIGGPYRTLTQDVSLYLVAVSQGSVQDNILDVVQGQEEEQQQQKQYLLSGKQRPVKDERGSDDNVHIHDRALRTLEALKSRTWKGKWPLVTEVALKSTGPWTLKPYQYHNLTFWPWTTGIEMLARSRFDRVEDSNILLSTLTSESGPHMRTLYEWVNPLTGEGEGAFPFRTGISAVRWAIVDIFNNIKKKVSSAAES